MIRQLFSSKRQRMSRVDTAWLRMERSTNLMMITGVIGFDGKVERERLVQVIRERFLSFRRFRQRARDVAGVTYWEDDAHFDLRSHLHFVALPGKADKPALEEYVSDLASTRLDPSRPLWQFHLVDNYEKGDVLIGRFHHCYADGIAMIQVLLSLTDEHADQKRPPRFKARRGGNVADRLVSGGSRGLEAVMQMGAKAVGTGVEMIRQPEKALELAGEGLDIASELSQVMTLSDDPDTRFKGKLGVQKRAAWCDPLPIGDIKALGRAVGCTVNDVLLAAVTGALRSYLLEQGSEVTGKTIRATVPVNLRPLEHALDLGNHFGLVFLELPIGEANPLKRLEIVRENMRELKSSRQAVVAFGLLSLLGMGPSVLQQPALDLLSKKATAVMTNVPGPRKQLFLAGAPVRELMFWVPQTGSVGMGVSILSYAGKVYFGLITDAGLVPEPGKVVDRFAGEFEKMLMAALLAPWEVTRSPEEIESMIGRWEERFGE